MKVTWQVSALSSVSPSGAQSHAVAGFAMIAAAAAVLLVSVVSVLQLGTATPSPPIADLEAAQSLLDRYDINYSKLLTAATVAAWNFKTNITDANKEKKGVANRKVGYGVLKHFSV